MSIRSAKQRQPTAPPFTRQRKEGERADEPSSSPLISVRQFCATYSLGRTRLYELLHAGEIEAVKVGQRTLIVQRSVDAWVARLSRFGGRQ